MSLPSLFKKAISLFVFVFCLCTVNGQAHKEDSLVAAIKAAKEDTNKVNLLIDLVRVTYLKGKMKATDSLAKIQLALSQKLNYESGIAAYYREIGSVHYIQNNDSAAMRYFMTAFNLDKAANNNAGLSVDYTSVGLINTSQGNYDEALGNYKKAMELPGVKHSPDFYEITYQRIGIAQKKQGNYSDALKNYLQSQKVAESLKDYLVMGDNFMNMGNIYMDMKNDSLALKSYLQALDNYKKVGAEKNEGGVYGNIGNVYFDKHNDSAALRYYLMALNCGKARNDAMLLTNAYGNLGNLYERESKYDVALNYQQESLKLDQQIDDREGQVYDYINIAGLLIKQKKYRQATDYTNNALNIAKAIHGKYLIKSAYEAMASMDTTIGDFKKGFFDYTNFISYRDSVINEQTTRKLLSEQLSYEYDKKAAIAKAEQEKKDAVAKVEKRRQWVIIFSVSTGLVLVLIFAIVLLSRFRLTQKQNKIIEEQKALVEERNKEVTASITYARRLQDAILPPLAEIEKCFPESFLLYKPKDIVAGDFYWIAQPLLNPPDRRNKGTVPVTEPLKDDKILLIAAADCTGHGVPGAMVSVVCSNALNRTVKEFRITEPGKVLDKTRELVLETFEKSESNVQDGMDISLASIIPTNEGVTVSWAGAFNPLWYIQNGELKELAPDKQPIGKTDNPKPFTTHTITLQKGDSIYLFTDGYADQFGGPGGKKYKSKQLQEKLLSVAGLSMQKQKEALEKALAEWKGNLEQVDDILVIGIRV